MLTWREMMRALRTMTEKELTTALADEVSTHKRIFVAERIHQRLCAVRAVRERQELFDKLKIV
jgi:hypothetical protein